MKLRTNLLKKYFEILKFIHLKTEETVDKDQPSQAKRQDNIQMFRTFGNDSK